MVNDDNKARLKAAEKQLELIKNDHEKKDNDLFHINITLAINRLNAAEDEL